MSAEQQAPTPSPMGLLARYERSVLDRVTDFNDPRQEWRRLFSELLGTFFLVLAAAGGGMMGHAFPGVISHADESTGGVGLWHQVRPGSPRCCRDRLCDSCRTRRLDHWGRFGSS